MCAVYKRLYLTPTAPHTLSIHTCGHSESHYVILISTDQTGHCLDLGVVLVRFGLGRSGT